MYGFRTSIQDKAYPIKCPEADCSCHLDLEHDVKPVFVTKKERIEYAELLDIAAISCIEDKDRFYCPNQACSALYEFTNNKYAVLSFEKSTAHEIHCNGSTQSWPAALNAILVHQSN